MNIEQVTGCCPYCGSEHCTSGSYLYHSNGTRSPSFICKECGHSFSFNTYNNDKTKMVRCEELLHDNILLGWIEEVGNDTYRITEKGRKMISDVKKNGSVVIDRELVNIPFWRDVLSQLPNNPTKEMFSNAVRSITKDDGISGSAMNNLWNKYIIEVKPAKERLDMIPGIRGLQGITLNHNNEVTNPV